MSALDQRGLDDAERLGARVEVAQPRRNHLDQREILAERAGLRDLLLVDAAVLLPLGTQEHLGVAFGLHRHLVGHPTTSATRWLPPMLTTLRAAALVSKSTSPWSVTARSTSAASGCPSASTVATTPNLAARTKSTNWARVMGSLDTPRV